MFKKTLYTLTALSISTAAMASGYQISEYTATGLGRSFAGSGVMGDDFSAMAFNPAGMQYNQTNGVQAGASAIILHADYYDRQANEKDDSVMGRVLPHFFTQYKLNDKLTLGAGIYTPYGLITDYDNQWSGGGHGIFSGLKAVDMSLGASYQIHPMFAVGAAVNGQYVHARLTSADTFFKDLEGDDIGVGYSVGVTFTPRKDTRLGVSYRSKVSHELKGDITLGNPMMLAGADIRAKITTPELVLFSGAYDFNDKLTLSATARWTRWSRFDDLNVMTDSQLLVYGPGSIISSTHENWKDTWFFSLGADYKINENWTLRFGGAYDETVIKKPIDRTVRVPDGRRLFASLGVSYMTGNWQYDVGYTHVWMRSGDAKGKDSLYAGPAADVHYNDAGAYMAGFAVQYKF